MAAASVRFVELTCRGLLLPAGCRVSVEVHPRNPAVEHHGDVGMETYLRTLKAIGYAGPLTIEREIPQEPERQKAEIGRAIRLLNEWKAKIG